MVLFKILHILRQKGSKQLCKRFEASAGSKWSMSLKMASFNRFSAQCDKIREKEQIQYQIQQRYPAGEN